MTGEAREPASVVAARQLAAEARSPLPRRLSRRARLLVAARAAARPPLAAVGRSGGSVRDLDHSSWGRSDDHDDRNGDPGGPAAHA